MLTSLRPNRYCSIPCSHGGGRCRLACGVAAI